MAALSDSSVAAALSVTVTRPSTSGRVSSTAVETVGALERRRCLGGVVAGDARAGRLRRCSGRDATRELSGSSGCRAARERRGSRKRVDDRQRVDALEEVLAGGLAERVVGRGEVEHVVDDLEAHAEVVAEPGERVERGVGDARDHAADAARRREQRRGLALDRRRVVLLGAVDVEEVLQLEHLAAAQLADRGGEQRRRRRRRATRRATTRGRGGSRRRGSRRCCSSGRSRSARRAGSRPRRSRRRGRATRGARARTATAAGDRVVAAPRPAPRPTVGAYGRRTG